MASPMNNSLNHKFVPVVDPSTYNLELSMAEAAAMTDQVSEGWKELV